MNTCTLDEARAAKSKAASVFASLAPIVAVGITRIGEGYGLKINLREKTAAVLPKEIGGVPVQVEVVGPIEKR